MQSTLPKYDENFNKYSIMYRPGRKEFLEYLFNTYKGQFDIAVWSSSFNQADT